MIQPGIIIIGDNFFIKVEDQHMQLKNATLQIAFVYALSYYFILDVDYPVPLKFFMVFLESVMGIPITNNIVAVKRLISAKKQPFFLNKIAPQKTI
jgi:hypothetical protein